MWPVDACGAQRRCVINLKLCMCSTVGMSDAVMGSDERVKQHCVCGATIIVQHGSVWECIGLERDEIDCQNLYLSNVYRYSPILYTVVAISHKFTVSLGSSLVQYLDGN